MSIIFKQIDPIIATLPIFAIIWSLFAEEPDSSRKWSPNPSLAAGLSLVIPGAGQVYNRSYWKAPITAATEGYAAWAVADAAADMRAAERDGRLYEDGSQMYLSAQARWENARERRNIHIWLLVGLALLSAIDAYVDAHLYDWSREMSTPVAPPESEISLAPTLEPRGAGISLAITFDSP